MEGGRNIGVKKKHGSVFSCMHPDPTGDRTHDLLVYRVTLQLTEPHRPGLFLKILIQSSQQYTSGVSRCLCLQLRHLNQCKEVSCSSHTAGGWEGQDLNLGLPASRVHTLT